MLSGHQKYGGGSMSAGRDASNLTVRLDRAMSCVVLVVALVVGAWFVRQFWMGSVQPPPNAPSPVVGAVLPTLEDWSWASSERHLVLVLSTNCRYCIDSAPFYRQLAALKKSDALDTTVVAAFPESPQSIEQFLGSNGIELPFVAGVGLSDLQVKATPTVILADREGRVLNVWVGQLSQGRVDEVIKTVQIAPRVSELKPTNIDLVSLIGPR